MSSNWLIDLTSDHSYTKEHWPFRNNRSAVVALCVRHPIVQARAALLLTHAAQARASNLARKKSPSTRGGAATAETSSIINKMMACRLCPNARLHSWPDVQITWHDFIITTYQAINPRHCVHTAIFSIQRTEPRKTIGKLVGIHFWSMPTNHGR